MVLRTAESGEAPPYGRWRRSTAHAAGEQAPGGPAAQVTCPALPSSARLVTCARSSDWLMGGTWAERGGAGWRGGTGGGAARGGSSGAGAVGSRQINMESIFHEKVSIGVRWGAVRGSAAGVGNSVAASGAQGGARAPPSQPGWVRGASCLLPMALFGKRLTCAPGALAPEDRAGNQRSIGISGA